MLTAETRASRDANDEKTGRTLAGTAHTLSYDYEGQLTQITQGQDTTDFVYDALGRRHSRTAGGTTTVCNYAGRGIVLEKQGETVTASNQSVTGTINIGAFGQIVGTSGSSDCPYMYRGAWGCRTDGDARVVRSTQRS